MLELKQTFDKPLGGYWDGGPKAVFLWSVDILNPHPAGPGRTRVGSWDANRKFIVATGKTDKQTLGNLRRKLTAAAKGAGLACRFEYVGDVAAA